MYGRRWPSLASMSSASLPRHRGRVAAPPSRRSAGRWRSRGRARGPRGRSRCACTRAPRRPPSGCRSPARARSARCARRSSSRAGRPAAPPPPARSRRRWRGTRCMRPRPVRRCPERTSSRQRQPLRSGESAGAFAAGRKAVPADGAKGARRGVHSRIAEPCRAGRPRVTVRGSSAMIGSSEARHRSPPSFLAQPVSARSRSRLSRHAAPRGSLAVGARLFAPSPPWLASGPPLWSWTPPASFCPRRCSLLPAWSRR